MGERDPEHPRTDRADHERRAVGARAARQQLAVAGLVEPPLEVDRAVVQQRPDDREGLLESVDPVIEREAERPELGLVPAGAQAEDQAAAADLVDRAGLLGEERRVVEVRARDERPELDPGRGRGDGRHHRPRLPRTARRPVGPSIQEVLAEPDRVVAEVLDRADQVEHLGPADLALDLGELDADLERALPHGGCQLAAAGRSAAAIARR